MKNIVIIEDTSINDLGGGQRVTLESIDAFKKHDEYKVWVFDIGGGLSFTKLVNNKNVFLKSFHLANKVQFSIMLIIIVLTILKQMKNMEFIAYPVTKKGLLVTFFIKMFRSDVKTVFHQHIRLNFFFNKLKNISQKVILPSKFKEDFVVEHIVIQNPVVTKKVKAEYSGRSKDELVIGFMGALTKLKGFDVFLQAIQYCNFKVKIAGQGELEKSIPDKKNVEYLGYLNEELKLDFLKGIDVLVFPSIVPEPFSLVCFESLFNYNPIVCFDLGYPSQVVRNFNVGVVACGIDGHSLADAIEKCSENIELLSENCYGVIERYDNKIFETDLIKVFNEL